MDADLDTFVSVLYVKIHDGPRIYPHLRRCEHQLRELIRLLGQDADLWEGDTWVMDLSPVECGRSRPTVLRSDLVGWAGFGYCASHLLSCQPQGR